MADAEKVPVQCPFADIDPKSQVIRRQDLISLGKDFKDSLAPLSTLVSEMKTQNVTSTHTNRRVRWNTNWMIILTLGLAGGLVINYFNNRTTLETAKQQHAVLEGGKETQRDLAAVTKELRELMELARRTKEVVEDIEEDQEGATRVELVPETDPVKARIAPVKLRVSKKSRSNDVGTPTSQKPVSSTAVEISIPSRSVRHQ